MLALLLLLVLVWVALGIIGFVVKGLFVLFVVACILFAATVLGGLLRGTHRTRITR